jgi:hypothetical protein
VPEANQALSDAFPYRAMDIETLRRDFAEPPREAGPWVYWFCFDNAITKDEMSRELEEMAAAGIAGAELRFVEFDWWRKKEDVDRELKRLGHKRLQYLSDEFLNVLDHTCGTAERLGMKLAINLGMGWPPGGTWIPEEHRTRNIRPRATVVAGPTRLEGDAAIQVPAESLVLAWQLNGTAPEDQRVVPGSFQNLTDRVRNRGPTRYLDWDVPGGRWLIGVFEFGYGGPLDKAYGWPADPGAREAIRFHLDHVLGRLESRLKPYFGSTLTEVATDSWEYDDNDWSLAVADEFPRLVGYNLLPRLYAYLGYDPNREQILHDVDRAMRRLVRDNFFSQITESLHCRGLLHRPQVRGRGLPRDFFEAYAHCDIPEVEEEVYLPEAVWAAHTLGKPIVSVEAATFISGHGHNLMPNAKPRRDGALDVPEKKWETNPAQLRRHANAHYARGMNRVLLHSFSYSPPGLPPPGWRMYAEVHLNRNVPWWPHLKELSAWSSRLQWVLQAGGPVADVVVYPVQSNPPNGPYNILGDHQPVSAINAIDAANSYTFPRVRKRSGKVPYDFNRLCLLDDVPTVDEVRHIRRLLESGVKIMCCRALPDEWSAFNLQESDQTAKADALLRSFHAAEARGQVVDARADRWRAAVEQARSVRWIPSDASLTFQHRRVKGGEVYFLMNWGEDFKGEVSFPHADLVPEIWDADTGRAQAAGLYRVSNWRTEVSFPLGHLQSTVVVFVAAQDPLHAVRCEGGRVARDADGRLWGIFENAGTYRVQLSDGTARDLQVQLPPAVPLKGPWRLFVDGKRGVGVDGPVTLELPGLVSWRRLPELRTYAGVASYTTTFDLPPDMQRDEVGLVLELGDVYELAEIWINDVRVGVSWYPPYRIDVTGAVRAGYNSLRIDVPNILKNHLARGDYDRPSGLLGPVLVRPYGRASLSEP